MLFCMAKGTLWVDKVKDLEIILDYSARPNDIITKSLQGKSKRDSTAGKDEGI